MTTPQPRLAAAMTPFPYSIDINATLAAARAVLAEHAFHHLPVTAAGKVTGILHGIDVAENAHGAVADHYRPDVYVVDIETPLSVVLTHMAERHVDAAVVMRQARLAGVFTTTDACRAFAALLTALWPEPGDDEAA